MKRNEGREGEGSCMRGEEEETEEEGKKWEERSETERERKNVKEPTYLTTLTRPLNR